MGNSSEMLISLREKEQSFNDFMRELEETERLIYMRNGK